MKYFKTLIAIALITDILLVSWIIGESIGCRRAAKAQVRSMTIYVFSPEYKNLIEQTFINQCK